jgi:hypothetical protein
MGITEEDGATVTEAYDTLKEVAAWIDEHGEVAAAFTTDIAALKTAVGVAPAEGVEGSGLLKAMADAQAAITALQGTTEDHETRIEALEAIEPTKVEASTVNGNILVDGEEVVVYTHPETHSADMIVETDDRKFVTAAEKDLINNAAAVKLVASQDEVVNETDFYMVEIA